MLTVRRVMGTETEYALLDAARSNLDPQELSVNLLRTWEISAADSLPSSLQVPDPDSPLEERRLVMGAGCRFDYSGEHPERDERGFEQQDLPAQARTNDELGAVLTGAQARWVQKVNKFEAHYYRGNATHLPNGARLYIDHTHPEYATPECLGPDETVLHELAGDYLMEQAGQALAQVNAPDGRPYQPVLIKNNTDGKGAAWGAHENYLVKRETDWETIVQVMLPFLVSRPIIGGAGRIGIGEHSEQNGFQIFQRADYIEEEVSLFTTHQRPIVNTRDEPHCSPHSYRRFHLTTADSLVLMEPRKLCLGITAVVLDLIEKEPEIAKRLAEQYALADPVAAIKQISHDTTLQTQCQLKAGGTASALQIQEGFLRACQQVGAADEQTQQTLTHWQSTLDKLSQGWQQAATCVQWCAKLALWEKMCQRYQCDFNDPRIVAADLQFSMLGKTSLARIWAKAKGIVPLKSEQELEEALAHGSASTRSGGRARLFTAFPNRVWAASWTSWLLDIDRDLLLRVQLPNPYHPTAQEVEKALVGVKTGKESQGEALLVVLRRLGLEIPEELTTVGWDEGFYADGAFGKAGPITASPQPNESLGE